MKKKLALLLTFTTLIALPFYSGATAIKLMDLQDMILKAKAIGLFKVTSRRYFTINGRHVFTRYYLRALICYAGCREGAQFTVGIPGGKVTDKIAARVTGAPELQQGINYVLILTRVEGSPDYSIAGFNQGAFLKLFDENKKAPYLKPLSLPFIKVKGKKVKRIFLKDFLNLINEVLKK